MDRTAEPGLTIGDVRIGERDVEMLEAIDRYGSMHRAAEELGRSYARIQRRVVELEEVAGQLTERVRGGADGGGTELTAAATRLCRQFDRLEAEIDGVASVTESVFTGTVESRTGELASVSTSVGTIRALVPDGADEVQVAVRSDAVVLTDPAETPEADGTSLRNQFAGTVVDVEPGAAIARVQVALEDGDGVDLEALLTEESRNRLELEPGRTVVASFKATAARGIGL